MPRVREKFRLPHVPASLPRARGNLRTVPVERRLWNRRSRLCVGSVQVRSGLHERRAVRGECAQVQYDQLDVRAVLDQYGLQRRDARLQRRRVRSMQ